jgi:hypothetical protein
MVNKMKVLRFNSSQKTKKLPDKIKRPIFVQYVTVRRCRFNPSYENISRLSNADKWQLWDRWAKKNFGIEKPELKVSRRK